MIPSYLNDDSTIAVIGHGSWGSSIVKILTDNNNTVFWYVRNSDVAENIKRKGNNPKYLSNIHYNLSKLTITENLNEAIENSSIIILATPSAFLIDVLADMTVSLEGKFIISSIKGIIPKGYLTIAEFVNEEYNIPFDNIGVLSGPCHAEEIALERLSYLTMVCKDLSVAEILGKRFNTQYIKITTSTDIYGVEYATVLKNIYAIAVGICHSLGYGDNFMSVLISNASIEMNRFMIQTYPCNRETNNSVYLGDLLVTCYSKFSRNRAFGIMIGKGYSVKVAQIEMNMVAEGYYASACIKKLIEKNHTVIDMPIADAIYSILYEKKNPKIEIKTIIDKLV